MSNKTYLVLLVDRVKAEFFTLLDGSVGSHELLKHDQVPQRVKHGSNTWDAQDKIMRHIEDHLRRHLRNIFQAVRSFTEKNHVDGIIIGSHKPLFSKIEKHLSYPLDRKIKGRFVTELKGPFNEVLKRAKKAISEVENKSV